MLGTVVLTRFGLLLWSTPAKGTGEGEGEWEEARGMVVKGEDMGEVGRERLLLAGRVAGIWRLRPLREAGGQRREGVSGGVAVETNAHTGRLRYLKPGLCPRSDGLCVGWDTSPCSETEK